MAEPGKDPIEGPEFIVTVGDHELTMKGIMNEAGEEVGFSIKDRSNKLPDTHALKNGIEYMLVEKRG